MVEEIVKKTTDGAKIYAKDLVRVDSDLQKIDKFFQAVNKTVDVNKKPVVEEYFNEINKNDFNDNQNDIINNDKNNIIKENNDHTSAINEETSLRNHDSLLNVNMEEVNDLESSLIHEPVDNKLRNEKYNSVIIDNANITYVDPKESFKTRTFKYERIETKLTSVKQLRLDIENKCNTNLREILANLIFIACIDSGRSLIQHSTKLYLCDTRRLTLVKLYILSIIIYINYTKNRKK